MPKRTSPGRRHNDSAKQAALPTVVVESQEQIATVCQQARNEGRFAFDTEFVMEDRYEPEVCLVQLATAEQIALIDPFRKFDLTPIWALVADPSVEAVVHAGQEDLALCYQHAGRLPRNVFDVQIAAGFVGWDYPLSLQKLVQAALHHRIHKSKTLTDWRRRPLTESQFQYAAEDVAHLLAAREKIVARLIKRGRMEWAAEEFRRFEELSLYGRVEEEKLRRLKGTASMGGRQLAIVRAMLHWRDGMARELNRPARVVLKDHLLVEIAKLGLTARDEIRELRGLNLSDKHINQMGQVVAEASALPPENWPEPAAREFELPREEAIVGLLTAVLRSHCLDVGLAYGLAATKQMIRNLARHRARGGSDDSPSVELLNGWREQTIGVLLDQILAGKQKIEVLQSDGEHVIRVSN